MAAAAVELSTNKTIPEGPVQLALDVEKIINSVKANFFLMINDRVIFSDSQRKEWLEIFKERLTSFTKELSGSPKEILKKDPFETNFEIHYISGTFTLTITLNFPESKTLQIETIAYGYQKFLSYR